MIVMLGTMDWPCWLAETREIFLMGVSLVRLTWKISMLGWWMVHTTVRPVCTVFFTDFITVAAARASKPAAIQQPFLFVLSFGLICLLIHLFVYLIHVYAASTTYMW